MVAQVLHQPDDTAQVAARGLVFLPHPRGEPFGVGVFPLVVVAVHDHLAPVTQLEIRDDVDVTGAGVGSRTQRHLRECGIAP